MRKGRDLEKLVAAIEKKLNSRSDATIESPAFIVDKINEQNREHDVLVKINNAHHKTIISFECKDRKTPVGSPDVEAYAAKCQASCVNQGIFVSSNGFTKPALKKAKFHGIKCFSLEDAINFKWLSPEAVLVEHRRNLGKVLCNLIIDDNVPFPLEETEIYTSDGALLGFEVINNIIKMNDDKIPWGESGKELEYNAIVSTPGWYIKHAKSDLTHPLKGFNLNMKYTCEHIEHAFQKKGYVDKETGKTIADMAYVPIELHGEKVKIAIMDTEQGRTINIIKD